MTRVLLVSLTVTVCLQQVLPCKVFVLQQQSAEGLAGGRCCGRGTGSHAALGAITPCRYPGKGTHLLIPECGVDTCSWTRKCF